VHLREDGSAAYSFHANVTADRGLRPEHLAALPDGGTLPAGTALHLGSLGLLARTPGLHARRTDSPGGGLAAGVPRPERAAGPGHRPRRLSPAVRRVGGARRHGEGERRGPGLAPPR
jgi:hypothetical protein